MITNISCWRFDNELDPVNIVFQEGIQPMWEDDCNRLGGRWLVNLDRRKRGGELDRFWLETVC